MSELTAYNKKIAELVLHSVKKYIEQEHKLQVGGGCYVKERPLCIGSICEPSMGIPSNSLSGGKFRMPKIPKSITRTITNGANDAMKVIKPIANRTLHNVSLTAKDALGEAIKRIADHVEYKANELADNGLDRLYQSTSSSLPEGSGMRKRGRPRKAKNDHVEVDGGRFNFIRSLKKVGHTIEHVANPILKKVGDVVVNKGIDYAIKGLSNPAVDEGLAEGAMAVACGVKKRKPSRRNMLIKHIMREKHLTLPQASKYIKQHNLK